MRFRLTWLVGSVVVAAACYQQPQIPPDKPLSCTADEPGQCPAGFACIDNRICAPRSCALSEDCPGGLVCGRNGCILPGAGDGGVDGGGSLGLPDALALPPVPDVRQDAGVVIDLGGGA